MLGLLLKECFYQLVNVLESLLYNQKRTRDLIVANKSKLMPAKKKTAKTKEPFEKQLFKAADRKRFLLEVSFSSSIIVCC